MRTYTHHQHNMCADTSIWIRLENIIIREPPYTSLLLRRHVGVRPPSVQRRGLEGVCHRELVHEGGEEGVSIEDVGGANDVLLLACVGGESDVCV